MQIQRIKKDRTVDKTVFEIREIFSQLNDNDIIEIEQEFIQQV